MGKIKLNFAFLCDQAFFDDRHKLNVIGIFKSISSRKFPFKHPKMFIVSNIYINTPGNYKKEIKIIRVKDNSEIIDSLKFDVNVKESENYEFGVIGELNNIEFDEEGDYEVQIFINSELVNTLPFNLLKI